MATIVGTRSPLFYKNVAGGMPAIIDTSRFSGNIFFVDSAVGVDGAGYGSEPGSPLATIDYAIGLCTANQGDVIFVLPGHSETINTAGGITCDKAGVSVIGVGNGDDRPIVIVGSSLDTSTILISAVDVLLKNLVITPGNDGVDVLVDIDADGAIIEDCELRSDEANAYQADTYIDINGGGANAADRVTIRRCKISSITAGANQAIEIGAVQDALRIEKCWINGNFAVAGIHSGSILTNALIARNYIHNVNAGDFCIEFAAAATGLLVDNRLYADAAATTLDPGSMMCVGNEMVNAIDNSSVPVPTTAGGVLPTGAIGAASFAAGAVDADAIADNAIDAGALALSVGEKTTEGVIVTRATAALPQATSAALFTVTGLCLLKRIVGYVTVGVGAFANATKIVGKSTGVGANTDLCGTVELNAAAGDSRLEITGTFANAMVKTVDVPLAKVQVTDIVIPPGTIDVDCAGSDGGGGRVKWSVTYVPMESGAQIVAA